MNTPKWRTRIAAVALVVGVGAAGAACASGGGYANPAVSNVDSRSVVLRVNNQNWQDVRIYLAREFGGLPMRIGTVGGLGTAILRIREGQGDYTRLLLRPIGSRATFITNAVNAAPGQAMELTVGSRLTFSNLVLR